MSAGFAYVLGEGARRSCFVNADGSDMPRTTQYCTVVQSVLQQYFGMPAGFAYVLSEGARRCCFVNAHGSDMPRTTQ